MPIENPEGVDPPRTNPRDIDGDHDIALPAVPRTVASHVDEGEAPRTPVSSGIVPARGDDQNEAGWFHAHAPAASPNLFDAADIASESEHGLKIARLHTVIKAFDPDAYPALVVKVMADLHQATNGEEYAFGLLDWWLRGSSNYPGEAALELQWAQLSAGARDFGYEGQVEELAIDTDTDALVEQPQLVVSSSATTPDGADGATQATSSELTVQCPLPEVTPLAVPEKSRNPLDPHSLRGMASTIEQMAGSANLFFGMMALLGQFMMMFAMPNTGKTLLAFALLIDAIIRGLIDPRLLYYLNLDDSLKGLAEKLHIADEYGFNLLVEGFNDFSVKLFMVLIQKMIDTDQARGVIIVLDTWKRLMDVMDKKQVAKFTRLMRLFVLAGGTVIGLAHTNKNLGANGKPVPAGTSDVLDDCDCAYVMRTVEAKTASNEKVIVAENIKRRGDVIQTIAYAYTLDQGITYAELVSSVRVIDDVQLTEIKQASQIATDADLIAVVASAIAVGTDTKMRLRDTLVKHAGMTNRAAVQLLDKYCGDDPVAHRWTYSVHARGAKVFALHAPVVGAASEAGSSSLTTISDGEAVGARATPATPKRFKTMSEMDRHG